jgi:hypothetical protein
MKKTLLLMAAVVAMACSCDGEKDCIPCQKEDQAEATLAVNLDLEDDAQTKATAYVTAQPYETAINDVQVLVFDSSGALNAYVDADTKTSGINIKTTTGSKTICAVVNGPDLSSVTTIPELNAKTIDLGDNSITSTAGFVMAGSTSCNVTTSSQNVNVTVKRFVSRVALQKVNNALPASYGAMTINNVTLINVVGNQNLAGTATASTWYNKMGRKDGSTTSSHIIDGSTYLASHPTLTFKSVESSVANGVSHTPSTPYLFYTFPNSTITDVCGWVSPFTARKTRLVVVATISGKKYYYPVVIDTPIRNYAYTVELTITGLGSTDPDKPVSKGAINASVTVEGWATGSIYDETI